MKLTNDLLNNLSVGTDLSADTKLFAAGLNKKERFERFMNDANKSNDINVKKRDDKPKSEEAVKQTTDKKVSKNKNKADDSDKKNQVKKVNSNDNQETEKTDVDKIAEELNITPERVMEILAQMNITIEDLTTKPELLTDVLVAAFNVESPIELLNIPDVRELMANLKDILASEQHTEADSEPLVEAKPLVEVEPIVEVVSAIATEVDGDEIATTNTSKNTEVKNPKSDGIKEEVAQVDVKVRSDENVDTHHKATIGQHELKPATTVVQSESSNGGLNQDNGSNFIPVAVPVSNANEARTTFLRTEALKNINPQDVIKQMTETLKTDIRNGISEVKIVLKPEQLGEITLKLLTENGIITAKFVAENERVKAIIESNFDQLKDALEERGVSVSELSVSVGQEDNSDRMQHFLKEQQKSSARIRQIINGINGTEEVQSEQATTQITDGSVDFTA